MRAAVIGSGPSGVAAAKVMAKSGATVDIVDGGFHRGAAENTLAAEIVAELRQGGHLTATQMKALRFGENHGNSWRLLRDSVQSVVLKRLNPRQLEKRILGSDFTFRDIADGIPLEGLWMPRSLAIGGLSNSWGAACYPLRTDDYRDWPLAETELALWYRRAQELAGVAGEPDGLAAAYPLYGPIDDATGTAAFDPDSPCEALLSRWHRDGDKLAHSGISAGRSRLAVSPPSIHSGCIRCALCLFGCPVDAIWHSDKALPQIINALGVRHIPNTFVRRIRRDSDCLWLVTGHPGATENEHGPYDAVFLAAGAISSLRIAVDSLGVTQHSCRIVENDTFAVPFKIKARPHQPKASPPAFALSQAAIAVDSGIVGRRPSHLQLYRITESILGPPGRLLATLMPRIGQSFINRLQSHLMGLFYLHSDDSRSITVEISGLKNGISRLRVCGSEGSAETQRRVADWLQSVSALTGLSPIVSLIRYAPPGFSGHIGGTMPMATNPSVLQCTKNGEVNGLPGVYAIDMSVFPAMPAQNPTLTTMANAMRCAELAVKRSRTH